MDLIARTGRWGVGRRGSMLLLLSIIYVYIGGNVLLGGMHEVPSLFHTWMPDWVRIAQWIGPAVAAAWFAFREHDDWGWVLLLFPPLIRIGSFAGGFVLWLLPGGDPGYARGAWDLMLYLGILGVVVTAAIWPDYPPRVTPSGGDGEHD